MEKIKSLNVYQKGILIFMIAMTLFFSVIYPTTISKVGFEYNDTILVQREEKGNTVYAGKIRGEESCFIVSADKTIEFHYGKKVYGPYTAKKDPTAVPKGHEMSGSMTGVELREGEDILFRGGVLDLGEFYWLYSEDGTDHNFGVTVTTGDGRVYDADGNLVDPVKPTAYTILNLMNDPELTHKGIGIAWFGAVITCILNGISILFADELFHLRLAFHVRYVDDVEPSEWEIAGRYFSWTVMTMIALVIFIVGLQ